MVFATATPASSRTKAGGRAATNVAGAVIGEVGWLPCLSRERREKETTMASEAEATSTPPIIIAEGP